MKTISTNKWPLPVTVIAMILVQAVLSGHCWAIQNSSGRSQQENQMDESLKLPMDPETVVFQLAFTGGYRLRQPDGFVPTPRIRIYADGRVVTGQNRPDQEVFEIRLGDRQLRAFVDAVVKDLDVFSIDAGEIRRSIEATGRPVSIVDVPNTEVTVRLAEKNHSVTVFAAGFCAAAYPEIESLQRLAKIGKLAQRMVALAQLGGQEVLDAMIEFGNSEMAKSKFPEMRLSQDNLDSSKRIDKTSFEARFLIRFREGQKKTDSLLTVTVEYSPTAASGKVTIYLSPANE